MAWLPDWQIAAMRYPAVWHQVEADIQRFVAWLRALAEQMPAE